MRGGGGVVVDAGVGEDGPDDAGGVPVMVKTMVACLVCCHCAAHPVCQVTVEAALNV